jgi:hypothetical protein
MTEQQYKKMVYKKADKVENLADLTALLDEIKGESFDYGKAVYSAAAVMRAALRVVDLGLSGFQAGCVGWEMMEYLMGIEYPAKIVKFNDMLYPQYEEMFEKKIDAQTWEHLQKGAKKLLKVKDGAAPHVIEHWKSIVGGATPFGYTVVGEE